MAEEEGSHASGIHGTGNALKKHWKLLLIIGGAGLLLFLWWRSRSGGSTTTVVSSPTTASSGTSTAATSPVSTVTSPTSTVSTGIGTGSGGTVSSSPGSISPGSRPTTSTIKTAASQFTTPKLTTPSGYQQASSFAQAVADAKAGENVLYRNNLTDAFGALNPGTGTTPQGATIFVPTTVSTAAKSVGANSTYSTPPSRDGNYTKFLGTYGTAAQANAAVKKMGLGNNYLLATNGANASYTIWGP